MLVYFQGRGDWFFNDNPNNKFGPLLAHNFVFKDTETGETESTNEFFRLYDGIDQKRCNEFVGVFKLSKKDIAIYLSSNNLDHVEELRPCVHEYSGFYISLEENDYLSLSKNDFDNCFFLIQKEIDMSCFEHKKISNIPYVINNMLTVYNESEASDSFGENDGIDQDKPMVYFRGHGDWFLNDDGAGSGYTRTKVEHRVIDPNHQRTQHSFFYWPNDVIDGVFQLTDSDYKKYRLTGSIDKEEITRLSPCSHPDSAFKNLVDKGQIPDEIFDKCYFEIKRNRFPELALKRRPERRDIGKLEWSLEFIKEIDQSISDAEHKPNIIDNKSSTFDELKVSINKLAEVILGMAIHKHNYDPKNPTQTAYKSIQKSLNSKQISIETSIIEKCLAYGREVYSDRTTRKNDEGKVLSYNREMKTNIPLQDFLKLFDGMAMADYGHDHASTINNTSGGKNGSIPSSFKKIEGYKLSIGSDAVRNYLNTAKNLFHLSDQ